MQLQTQVPHGDWSSAAATSIPTAPTAPANKEEAKGTQTQSVNIFHE